VAEDADLGPGQKCERDVIQDDTIGRNDFLQFIEGANELTRHEHSLDFWFVLKGTGRDRRANPNWRTEPRRISGKRLFG
jgi:mannose-6-phosphate isomerase-like protein (cupin superfamily)